MRGKDQMQDEAWIIRTIIGIVFGTVLVLLSVGWMLVNRKLDGQFVLFGIIGLGMIAMGLRMRQLSKESSESEETEE